MPTFFFSVRFDKNFETIRLFAISERLGVWESTAAEIFEADRK